MKTATLEPRFRGHRLVRTAPLWMSVILTVALGCGGSKFQFAPVSGQVTLDGEPVNEARVVFMPQTIREDGEAGPYSKGETDANGKFTLATVEKKSRLGAVVGAHSVIISTRRAHLDPNKLDVEIIDSPETIPKPYTHYRLTPLTFDVPPDGTDDADFALKSSITSTSR